IGGMSGAEHPLIALHRSHAEPHLVSQGLECETTVSCGQRAAKGVARAFDSTSREKRPNCFFVAPAEQFVVAVEWDQGTAARLRSSGQMKTVNCVKKKQRANTFVQVYAGVPAPFEFRHFGKQLLRAGLPTKFIERAVADFRVRRRNDRPEHAQAPAPGSENTSRTANTLISSVRTSSRS